MSAPAATPAELTLPPPPLTRTATGLLGAIATLFIAATAGAWAWFHFKTPVREVSYEFQPRMELPGAKYTAVPISAQAAEMLANTNLINGKFTGADGRDITVFFGDWRARSAREMNVVQHTPDICWVGAGWTVVNADLPAEVRLQFGTESIPFVSRVFQAPRSNHKELTLWCTLVGGQVYDEGARFESESDASLDRRRIQNNSARRRAYEQFLRAVHYRVPSDGSKQFVRFSGTWVPEGDHGLKELVRFGQEWLQLRRLQ